MRSLSSDPRSEGDIVSSSGASEPVANISVGIFGLSARIGGAQEKRKVHEIISPPMEPRGARVSREPGLWFHAGR